MAKDETGAAAGAGAEARPREKRGPVRSVDRVLAQGAESGS